MGTVVFDLDGTLADTSGDLIAAANACFVELGEGALLDPDKDGATAFAGARAMLRLGLKRLGRDDEGEIDRQFPLLLAHYEANIDVHTRLYEGAMAAVNDLKTSGFKVAICTNKPEGLAEILMKKLGVREEFGALVGADTLSVRKPNPDPLFEAVRRAGGDVARCCLIGDTITDRDTARAAGVPSVLVTFGPDGRAVEALKPQALLNHYNELVGIVQRLIG